jgi:hypothetical protein
VDTPPRALLVRLESLALADEPDAVVVQKWVTLLTPVEREQALELLALDELTWFAHDELGLEVASATRTLAKAAPALARELQRQDGIEPALYRLAHGYLSPRRRLTLGTAGEAYARALRTAQQS